MELLSLVFHTQATITEYLGGTVQRKIQFEGPSFLAHKPATKGLRLPTFRVSTLVKVNHIWKLALPEHAD